MVNNSLFSGLEGFEEADKLVQQLNARKRGCYKIKPKKREYSPYTHIKTLYMTLGNFLPLPLFTAEKEIFDFGGIRAWYTTYHSILYEYEGKLYQGEDFKVIEAEIVGTENFDVDDRIRLHENLINLLRTRIDLDDAVKLIQQEIRDIEKKYKVEDITLWLKKQRI